MSNEQTLREALTELLHAAGGETGFAAAVRSVTGTPYPWPALDLAEEKAHAALALPASAHGAEPSDAEINSVADAMFVHLTLEPGTIPRMDREAFRETVGSCITEFLARRGAPTSPAAVAPMHGTDEIKFCGLDDTVEQFRIREAGYREGYHAALAAAPAAQAGAVPGGAKPVAAPPIAYALQWPEDRAAGRICLAVVSVDLQDVEEYAGRYPDSGITVLPFYAAPPQPAPAQPDAADAARYRWLRDCPDVPWGQFLPDVGRIGCNMDIGESIDAEIAAQAVAKGGDRG